MWLFVCRSSVVTMPKISLKTLYCYIFEKPKVQGHQNWYSQLSNTQIHKYKYTNTALLKCQEYQTYAIFLNSCWFKDVKNDIPKCPKWSDPTTDPTSDPRSKSPLVDFRLLHCPPRFILSAVVIGPSCILCHEIENPDEYLAKQRKRIFFTKPDYLCQILFSVLLV